MIEMNVCKGRILTMMAALLVATASTAFAADDGQSQSTGHVMTAQEKAAEAQRLAKQAAKLAQQAAALAAESQSDSAPAVSNEKKQPAGPTQSRRSTRDAADVRISDANASSSAAEGKVSGWRSHQDANDIAIRFKDDKAIGSGSDKISSEALADRMSLGDSNVHLASRTINDRDLRNANEQEPMPAPASANNGKSGQNGYSNGNGCGSCNSGCDTCGGCNSCNDGCGNCGCDIGCCNPAPCLFWSAGVEATFLSPNLNDNNATFEFVNTSEERDCFNSTNGIDSLYVAPRIWLGVESCCWGVDVKYWQMQASSQGWDPALGDGGIWNGPDCGVPDIGHFSENTMSVYALDLEVSRRLCVRDCWMQFSGGIRHAEFRHDQVIVGNANDSLPGATINDPSISTNLIGYARDDAFSQGTGIVLGWYGRRPVFPCSCVNWFYNLHYSVLWGPTNTAAETAAQIVVDDPGSAGSTNDARSHSDGTFTIGEVQLGLEWDYALQCIPANSFFRVALEYQRWDGGNGFSEAQSFAGTTVNGATNQGTFTASASAPEMNLFGFTLGTGLTW
jgi:hypothetical protein